MTCPFLPVDVYLFTISFMYETISHLHMLGLNSLFYCQMPCFLSRLISKFVAQYCHSDLEHFLNFFFLSEIETEIFLGIIFCNIN